MQDHRAPVTPRRQASHPQRRDIQGMRAIAVLLVIAYHLWPDLVPGGFVGVDVFFVISGFLIIGMLARELRATGTVKLFAFYAKRIRRLLPAALLVLLVTAALTLLVLPVAQWPQVMRDVVASALDVQNWSQAYLAGGYAEATADVSPLQHYWSLAVEEQFYLVVPVAMIVGGLVARRRRWTEAHGAVVVITAITLSSLACSVIWSNVSPSTAYFVTPTRMWELGVGGLAALGAPRLRMTTRHRVFLGWAGVLAVAVAAGTFSTSMAFPGWVALLPVAGSAAMLLAGDLPSGTAPARAETAHWLALRPMRYVGDISYSLYLWHWPVLVFVLARSATGELGAVEAVTMLALSLALAALTKRFVEDTFRARRKVGRHSVPRAPRAEARPVFLTAAIAIVLTCGATIVPWHIGQVEADQLVAAAIDAKHPGAMAFDGAHPMRVVPGVALQPDPSIAFKDRSFTGGPGCDVYDYKNLPLSGPDCVLGNPSAPHTIVLLGDSHAAQFSTPLQQWVSTHPGWKVKVAVRFGCPFTLAAPRNSSGPLTMCSDQNRAVLDEVVALHPDLVVTSAMSPESYARDLKWSWSDRAALVAGYRDALAPLARAGIRTVVLRDVPRMAQAAPACLRKHEDEREQCDTPSDVALPAAGDPLVEAAEDVDGVEVLDLTPWLCRHGSCPAVIGNVVVYRDNHLTNTFVRTLSPILIGKLRLA